MPNEFLNATITISIGMAALTSLITLFKSGAEFAEAEILEFREIVLSCLLICIGAVLPLLLSEVFEDNVVWSISSVVFAIFTALLHLKVELNVRANRYIVFIKTALPLRITSAIITFVVLLNPLIWQNTQPFLLGMFWVLIVTAWRIYIFLLVVTGISS